MLLLLIVIVIVGLLGRGGSSHKTPAKSASAPRSVFPTPSTVPTAATPTVSAPAPTTPAASTPAPAVKKPPPGQHGNSCQPVQVNGHTVSVTILKGKVICQNARLVASALKSGKGKHRGSPGDPFVRVLGWKCVPSGTCTLLGKSIKIS